MDYQYDRRDPSDLERIADAAAHKAVIHTFSMLGIDITNQKEINSLRDVLTHARKMQQLSSRAGFMAIMVAITTVITAAITAMSVGLIEAIRRFPSVH